MSHSLDPSSAPPPQHRPVSTARQPSELEKAYRASQYRVDLADSPLVIRIGQPHDKVDALLAHHGCFTWAFLTAHNPGSVLLSAAENEVRQARLRDEVSAAGWVFYPGEGLGTAGWPGEESLLVLGIDSADALALAGRHGQLALVFGRTGETAQLLWTRADKEGLE
jgi:hypothetical protein